MDDLIGKLRKWVTNPWEQGSTPLEIRRAVLDEVESRIVPVGEGKRIFPYNLLRVHLLAPDPQEQASLEAAARHGWDIERQIAERLASRGCPAPPDLLVEIVFHDQPSPAFGDRRFYVEPATREAPPPEPGAEPVQPVLQLTVTRGTATQHVYELEGPRIYLGRLEEVVDADGRVRRRNDVAFQEGDDEVNSTVSREHARITWDDDTHGWWLRAEQNASGTRIYRGGKTIDVSAHDRRGVRLQAGDDIYLGRARVKVAFR